MAQLPRFELPEGDPAPIVRLTDGLDAGLYIAQASGNPVYYATVVEQPALADMFEVPPGGFFSFCVGDKPTWVARGWPWVPDADVSLRLARID